VGFRKSKPDQAPEGATHNLVHAISALGLKSLSIKSKLILITTVTTTIAVLIACFIFLIYDGENYNKDKLASLDAQARIMAKASAGVVADDDRSGAVDMLSSLREAKEVTAAALFNSRKQLLGSYPPGSRRVALSTSEPPLFLNNHVETYEPIRIRGRQIGTLYLESDLAGASQRQHSYLLIVLTIATCSAILVFLVSRRLQRVISDPILKLLHAMSLVSTLKNYGLRVEKTSDDEVGHLVEGFNGMLSEIEQRDKYLKAANEDLEARVSQRTRELEQEIADRRRAEIALAEANGELELALDEARSMAEAARAASLAKSDFLANMSHEIRTPMNGVMGMTGLMLETNMTPEQLDFTLTIKRSADSLLEIINDILDFSKAEAGKMEIDQVEMDLRTTIGEVGDLFAQRAQEKGLELICHVDPAIPHVLQGDPGRIRQVVSNLVTNAIKFTEHGEVVVEARLKARTPVSAIVVISIRDTGIGVPKERQEAIFESFTQVDGSTTRKYGGTGLGLAICRQLSQIMGGHVWVDSEPGEGSVFKVELPLALLTQYAHKVPVEPLKAHVLLVSGNGSLIRTMKEEIESWDCTVISANGMKEVMSVIRQQPHGALFQLIIVDQSIKDCAVEDFMRDFRHIAGYEDSTAILLTTRSGVAEARSQSFASVLAKPVRSAVLYETMAVALGLKSPTPEREEPLAEEPAELGHRRKVLLVEDNAINQKVATQLLRKFKCDVDVAGDGETALERLEKNRYSLVLMDVQMPGMDGYDTATEIRKREDEGQPRSTIVAMTANAMSGDRERCLEAGMDDYLAKPVKPDELEQMLAKWAGDGDEAVKCGHGVIGSHETNGLLSFNVAHLTESLNFDPSFISELLDEFWKTAPPMIDQVVRSAATGDRVKVTYSAHTLKGMCRTIGADRLALVCEQIEDRGHLYGEEDVDRMIEDLKSEFELLRLELDKQMSDSDAA